MICVRVVWASMSSTNWIQILNSKVRDMSIQMLNLTGKSKLFNRAKLIALILALIPFSLMKWCLTICFRVSSLSKWLQMSRLSSLLPIIRLVHNNSNLSFLFRIKCIRIQHLCSSTNNQYHNQFRTISHLEESNNQTSKEI